MWPHCGSRRSPGAGGQELTTRPTEDLDFFTAPDRGYVPTARDALEAAARKRGPTLAPEEFAGRKLLALFDRAAALDFAART
jgi:hypothetical protein